MSEHEAAYLAVVRELQQIAEKAPHVTQRDVLDIASMPVEELRRRAIRHRDWHGHFSHCLDGLPALRGLGAAPDGCWDPRTIRSVVEALLRARGVKGDSNG